MVWCWWQFIVDQHRISRSHRKESTVLSLAPKIEGSNSIGWAHIHGCYSTDDVCNKIEIAASVDACRREKVKKCRRVLAWRVETSDVFARPQLLHSNLTSCLSHNSVAPSDFLLWTSDTACIMRLLHGGYSHGLQAGPSLHKSMGRETRATLFSRNMRLARSDQC